MSEGLTPTQTVILELLKAGLRTGFIQEKTGAARSTISKCRRILRGLPSEEPMDQDSVKKRILKSLEKQALKGGSGSVQAAKELFRQTPDLLPLSGEEPLTIEKAVQLICQWNSIDPGDMLCRFCGNKIVLADVVIATPEIVKNRRSDELIVSDVRGEMTRAYRVPTPESAALEQETKNSINSNRPSTQLDYEFHSQPKKE